MLQIINDAIRSRQIIMFTYKGVVRTVEPYLTGRHRKTGNDSLRAWVLSGTTTNDSANGWRLYTVSLIDEVEVTPDRFVSNRPGYDPFDDDIDMVYASI